MYAMVLDGRCLFRHITSSGRQMPSAANKALPYAGPGAQAPAGQGKSAILPCPAQNK